MIPSFSLLLIFLTSLHSSLSPSTATSARLLCHRSEALTSQFNSVTESQALPSSANCLGRHSCLSSVFPYANPFAGTNKSNPGVALSRVTPGGNCSLDTDDTHGNPRTCCGTHTRTPTNKPDRVREGICLSFKVIGQDFMKKKRKKKEFILFWEWGCNIVKKVKHWGLKHDKWRFPWISTRKDDLRNSCFELRAWSWDKWNPYLKAPKFLFSFGLQHNWRWFSRFKNRHLLSHPQHSYILRWKLLFSVSSKAATSSLAHLVNMVTCNSVRKPPQDWSIFFSTCGSVNFVARFCCLNVRQERHMNKLIESIRASLTCCQRVLVNILTPTALSGNLAATGCATLPLNWRSSLPPWDQTLKCSTCQWLMLICCAWINV